MATVKIASILDEFSYLSFRYESDLIPLTEENWQGVLTLEKPDLLLVESTWEPRNRSLISGYLEAIVGLCNAQDIPTVFWNKEDPCHFDIFFHEARIFDYIFTTDSGCVPSYQAMLGHNRVFILPFAAQPKLFNPIGKDQEKLGIVAFAGTWYHLKPEREQDMHLILGSALKYGLHIYDRNYYRRPGLYPERYQPYVKGWVPYEKLGSIYKKYYIFININTVKNSETMFARRVFELLACGVSVISNYSTGIAQMFSGIVPLCNTTEDVEEHLGKLIGNKSLRDRRSLLGQREVFENHTYNHRLQTVLRALDYRQALSEPEGVSVIAWVDDGFQLERIWESFNRQSYPRKELILIFRNGINELEDRYLKREPVKDLTVLEFEKDDSGEKCLSFGLKHPKYQYLTYFHPDNYYGAGFIADLMNAFKYTDAAAVGKGAHYVFSPSTGNLEIRFPKHEYCYVKTILSFTTIAKREIFSNKNIAGFFQTGLSSLSGMDDILLYASDRFNFIGNCTERLSQAIIAAACF